MKPANGKALRKSALDLVRTLTSTALLLAAIVCCGWGTASASATDLAGDSLPPRNRHFFLVRLEQGTIKGHNEEIRDAFLHHEFTDCELQPSNDSVRLICEKGCSIERVREVLKELGLVMTAYQEAYTNQTPSFFH